MWSDLSAFTRGCQKISLIFIIGWPRYKYMYVHMCVCGLHYSKQRTKATHKEKYVHYTWMYTCTYVPIFVCILCVLCTYINTYIHTNVRTYVHEFSISAFRFQSQCAFFSSQTELRVRLRTKTRLGPSRIETQRESLRARERHIEREGELPADVYILHAFNAWLSRSTHMFLVVVVVVLTLIFHSNISHPSPSPASSRLANKKRMQNMHMHKYVCECVRFGNQFDYRVVYLLSLEKKITNNNLQL